MSEEALASLAANERAAVERTRLAAIERLHATYPDTLSESQPASSASTRSMAKLHVLRVNPDPFTEEDG
eukprot:6082740-Prymnesium_polylepis.1